MLDHDLLGIGNAIVDLLAEVSDDFLIEEKLTRGSMRLIGPEQAEALAGRMPAALSASGGSVANSCAVAALLGARVGFLGLVAEDAAGSAFRAGMEQAGVCFPTPPAPFPSASSPTGTGQPTARCLILVTPDGQRTMNTDLGVSVRFGPDHLDHARIAASRILYLEGYLFDEGPAQQAFQIAARLARDAGRLVALSLSDAFCVQRHRAAFQALLPQADLLFANESEITSLYETDRFDRAAEQARAAVPMAVLTRGARGSLVLAGAERIVTAAAPTPVVDTTGAGDAYAAGFLAALARGEDLAACATLGNRTAAAAIGQIGARPDAATLRRHGLLA